MSKLDKKYKLKRLLIFIIPIILGILVQYLTKDIVLCTNNNNMRELIGNTLGMWGSMLGFIITVESLFIGFDSKNINILRGTRVYKTMLYTFTLTCAELVIDIIIFICISFNDVINVLCRRMFVCGLVISFCDLILCIIFLGMGVYDSIKKE